MGKRQKMHELLVVEEALEKRQKAGSETQVLLEKTDFRDSMFSASGYKRLKQECEYIDYGEQIEIIIPKEYAEGFKEKLESMAATELKHIKKDRQRNRMLALILLSIGSVWFVLGQFFSPARFVREITIVATWVFIWAAVEKWFFDQSKLRDRRFSLLQILAAKITCQ